MREAAAMSRGFAILGHLLHMIAYSIDFRGRVFDRLGRAVRGLGRFVRRVERLCGRLFRARG